MRQALKIIHFLGLAGFLGSIAVYIALASAKWQLGSAAFATARQIILIGTQAITLPALIVVLASGIGLMWFHRHNLRGWIYVKLCLGIALCINAYLFVTPAITIAAQQATLSISDPSAQQAAINAIATETNYGAANVVLALCAMIVAVVRPRLGKTNSSR
jgi:uncharacterized membrane protein